MIIIVSGEIYVTISSVLPMLELVRLRMGKNTSTDTEDSLLTTNMKTAIVNYLNIHYSDVAFYKKATFLDPRYKLRFGTSDILEDLKSEARSLIESE